ncbi:MAG: hypothetical protein AABZ54_07715, partial [Bacteroidota bacterium]
LRVTSCNKKSFHEEPRRFFHEPACRQAGGHEVNRNFLVLQQTLPATPCCLGGHSRSGREGLFD